MELGGFSLQSLILSLGLVILGLTHGEGLGPTKRPLPGHDERGTCRECCERGLPGQQGNPGYPGVQGPAGLPGKN